MERLCTTEGLQSFIRTWRSREAFYLSLNSLCLILLFLPSRIGLSLPMNYNPAEFFVNLVSPITVQGVEHRERINLLCQLNKINLELELINALDAPKRSTSDIEEVEHLTWCMQIMVLLRRAALIGSRDIGESILHSSSHLLIALGIGVLYAGKSPNQQALISDVEGMFFNTIAEIFFYTYKRIVSVFEPELPIVRKETGENLYFISSYYIMKFLSLVSCPEGICRNIE